MRRRAAWTALLLLAAVLTGTPVQAAARSVTIRQYAYSPASLMVTVGDTVTWTNRDTAAHDVVTTSGPASFRSKLLATGESFSYTFMTAGTYQYYCSVHPDMRASVMVHAKPTTTAPQRSATRSATRAPARQTQISADRSTTTTTPTIGAAPVPAASTAPPSAPAIAAGAPVARADLQPLAVAAIAAVLAALISLFALGTRP